MIPEVRRGSRAWVVALSLAIAGCALQPVPITVVEPRAGELMALKAFRLDRATEDRILALDPSRVTSRDVADVLAKAPAPQMMLIHGGVYPVHLAMTSFGTFLTEMGYPEARIRDPGSGDWSYSPYTTTARLAGIVAWHYEQTGLRPMIVGHSQGGPLRGEDPEGTRRRLPAARPPPGIRSPTSRSRASRSSTR